MISDHTIHLGWTAYVSALILGNFTLSNYNIWRSFTISESSLYWVFDVSNRVRQGFVAPFGHGGWFRTIAEFDFLANLQPLWANSLSLSIGKYFMRDLETQWFEHTIHLGWSVYVCSALILVHIIWSNFNTLRGFSSPESLVFGWLYCQIDAEIHVKTFWSKWKCNLQLLWANSLSLSIGKYFMSVCMSPCHFCVGDTSPFV